MNNLKATAVIGRNLRRDEVVSPSFFVALLLAFFSASLISMIFSVTPAFTMTTIAILTLIFIPTTGDWVSGIRYLRFVEKQYGPKTRQSVLEWASVDRSEYIELNEPAIQHGKSTISNKS